ncbi:MAG: hypothetical protein ACI4PR_05985 [Acutalibacteraceae bacterium]
MTDAQKQEILNLKNKGNSCRKIAVLLSLSENTVKSFLRRGVNQKEKTGFCKNCNKKLEIIPKHRARIFCCDNCRIAYWRKMKKRNGVNEDVSKAV